MLSIVCRAMYAMFYLICTRINFIGDTKKCVYVTLANLWKLYAQLTGKLARLHGISD